MAPKTSLKAESRKITGRKVKTLRKQGILPANIFGKGVESQTIKLPLKSFQEAFKQAGETSLVDLVVDDKKSTPVLITNIHTDPVTGLPIHADFHQVDLTQTVTANIPVELVGESPAVKEAGGILVHAINEIEVEALPTELPESFEIDISTLKEIGDSILVSSLKTSDKVEIKIEDLESPIVLVQEQKEEEPEPEAETAEGEDAEAKEGGAEEKDAEAKEGEAEEKSE